MNKSKIILTISFICIVAYACSGKKKTQKLSHTNVLATDCIDSTKINKEGMCPAVWEPVCGCDGKTYGNSCEAMHAGVTKIEKGECENSK